MMTSEVDDDVICRKVFVVGIKPGGEASKDGRIQIGDQILEINGVQLEGSNQLAPHLINKSESLLVLIINRSSIFNFQFLQFFLFYFSEITLLLIDQKPLNFVSSN